MAFKGWKIYLNDALYCPLTLTWQLGQIWHIQFLQILNAPADCIVNKTLE